MQITHIDGTRSEINLQSDQAKAHFADPYNYTKEILEQFDNSLYKGFIEPTDKVFLDIGANVGLFALHVKPYAQKIICVEPTPEHMAIQRELVDFAIHEEAALNDYSRPVTFHWCGINTTMNSLQPRGDRSMTVQGITLADLVAKHNLESVDFLKFDAEGSEWTALTIETLMPVSDIITKGLIELHPPDSASQDHFKAIFEAAGYKVEKYIHDSLFFYK